MAALRRVCVDGENKRQRISGKPDRPGHTGACVLEVPHADALLGFPPEIRTAQRELVWLRLYGSLGPSESAVP